MVMRGFELLLIAHLVYIQVPSGSTLSTSPSTYTTYVPEPLIRQTTRVPTTPVPTTPVHTSPPPTSPPPTSPPPPVQTTPVPTTPPPTTASVPSCGLDDPCQPGGNCRNTTSGYTCICSLGYKGDNCSIEYDPCLNSPCHNGASCRYNRTEVSRLCICPEGFTGVYCETEIPECPQTSPCMNGATCNDIADSFTCGCPYGTTGNFCETVCSRDKIDLLLIEDASPSVTKTEDYGAMKEFETKLINDSRTDLSAIHVAEVVFGEEAKLGFYLNTFHNKASLQAAIAKSSKEGGPTHLVKPILLADLDVFIEKHGDRTDAKNVVVLFTDGRSRNARSLYNAATVLKKKALVFVVALTNEQDLANLASVGSGASYVFTDKQKALKAISDTLATAKC